MYSFETNQSFPDNYKLLIGGILPRPIAVVSTLNEDGSNNVAPFSFFTAISALPMVIAFSPLIRSSTGKEKDTPRNIKRSREFVINIFSRDLAEKINATSTELDYGDDEFEYAGLTPIKSEVVSPMRVKECLIHYECRLRDILNYGDGPGAGQLIAGEVVKVHVSKDVYQDGKIITSKLNPVGRGAGNDWFSCDSVFEMERKMRAQIQK